MKRLKKRLELVEEIEMNKILKDNNLTVSNV